MSRRIEAGRSLNLSPVFSPLKDKRGPYADVSLNSMPRINVLAKLQSALFVAQAGAVVNAGEHRTAVDFMKRGVTLVHFTRGEGGDIVEISWGIFDRNSRVIQDPNAFATLAGRRDRVTRVFMRLQEVLGGVKEHKEVVI